MKQNKQKQIKRKTQLFSSSDDNKDASPSPEAEQDQISEVSNTSSKSFVREELFVMEERIKSRVVVVEEIEEEEEEEKKKEDSKEDEERLESEGWAVFKADGVEFKLNLKQRVERERKENDAESDAEKEDDEDVEQYFIGESSKLKFCIVEFYLISFNSSFFGREVQCKAVPEKVKNLHVGDCYRPSVCGLNSVVS